MAGKFYTTVLLLIIGTTMSLVYIAGKVEPVKISYEIRAKERKIAAEFDQMKNLRYHLATLKSPSQLESRMIETDLELIPVQKVRVLRFAKRKIANPDTKIVNSDSSGRLPFLAVREAQAETNIR